MIEFQEACLDFGKWPDEEAPAHPPGPIWPWVEEVHACNARLRRSAAAGPESVTQVVQAFRSQRDEAIRRIDRAIFGEPSAGKPVPEPGAGALTDALSRLAFDLRAAQASASQDGGEQRLAALLREREALAARLDALLAGDSTSGDAGR